MTLDEFFKLFVQNHVIPHTRSLRDITKDYRLYLSCWADRELTSIKRFDVISLQAKLHKTKGASAANRMVEWLRLMFYKAIDWELIEGKNPAARIKAFKIQPRDRYLHPEELPRFFAALNELQNAGTRDYFLMLLFTGQRKCNVAEMCWEDIDTTQRVWRIPHTKNGTPHRLPLAPEAMALLARRHGDHPKWVFPRTDGDGPLTNRYNAWRQILKKSGIKNLRIHDLRHTLASWQAGAGVSIPVISKMLNHKDIKSTMIYAHIDLNPVRVAIDNAVKDLSSHMDTDMWDT